MWTYFPRGKGPNWRHSSLKPLYKPTANLKKINSGKDNHRAKINSSRAVGVRSAIRRNVTKMCHLSLARLPTWTARPNSGLVCQTMRSAHFEGAKSQNFFLLRMPIQCQTTNLEYSWIILPSPDRELRVSYRHEIGIKKSSIVTSFLSWRPSTDRVLFFG